MRTATTAPERTIRLTGTTSALVSGARTKNIGSHREKEAILELIGTGATWIYPGRNAIARLAHHFQNTGSTYQIDLDDMVQSVSSAKRTW